MAENDSHRANKHRIFLFLFLLAIVVVAHIAMIPAILFSLDPINGFPQADPGVEPAAFTALFFIVGVVVCAFAVLIGLATEKSTGFGVPVLRSWVSAAPIPESTAFRPLRCVLFASGFALLTLFMGFASRSQLPELPESLVHPPLWQGSLLAMGAAVREEVLFRFCALNAIVWLISRMLRLRTPTESIAWCAIVSTSLVFAVLHLLPLSELLELTASCQVLIVIGVTAAGVLFGSVYLRQGLIAAIFTHAIVGLLVYLGVRVALHVSG